MNKISTRISAIGMLAFLMGMVCAEGNPEVAQAAATETVVRDIPMLDILVQSPITIVQYQDGEVDLLLPNIDRHPYGFVKGLNDCQLEEGKGVDYQVNFNSNATSTEVDPDKSFPDEVKVDNNQEAVNVDPQKRRLSAIRLSRPQQIVALHLDGEGAAVYKPGEKPPKDHLYPTLVALRYKVPLNAPVSVSIQSSGKVTCPEVTVRPLGNERILHIGMGPAVEDEPGHPHAKLAFGAESDLLPPLKRAIYYPLMGHLLRTGRRLRASDCKAPILLITGANKPVPAKNTEKGK